MGTNFYIKETGQHIGKRSAAGLYCWDCGLTLCKGGEGKVHLYSYSDEYGFYDKCPNCGKFPIKESLSETSAGRELGFNENNPKEKMGVSTCSSFTWATHPRDLFIFYDSINSYCSMIERKDIFIRDEYNDIYDMGSFTDVLKECPIQFYNSIGKEFS